MTDDEIAKIVSMTRLRELPEMLDDDQWNNIEPALLDFARKSIAIQKERLAKEFAKALGWTWDNEINRKQCRKHAASVIDWNCNV